MNKNSGTSKASADKLVKTIRRKTRQTYSSQENIRIVLAGLRGEETISVPCRREGTESLYYSWSKEFLEAGKRRPAGGTARQATSPEVKELRSEATACLKNGRYDRVLLLLRSHDRRRFSSLARQCIPRDSCEQNSAADQCVHARGLP